MSGGATPSARTGPAVTVIVPFLDEEQALPLFVAALRPELEALGCTYEVVLVDDGSTDGGPLLIERDVIPQWPEVRLIRLTRNFGHMAALTAGLQDARGEVVASMDSDLQHPPEALREMLAIARDSRVDVVQGLRVDTKDSQTRYRRVLSALYYRLMSRLAGVSVLPGSADFRVLSRRVVDELNDLPESTRVYRLLIPWMGYTTTYYSYEAGVRSAGTSKYGMFRMIKLGWSSLRSFSTVPLRLATSLGLLTAAFGALWTLYVIVTWASGRTVPGWSGLMCAVLILGGVQLFTIGIAGEYLGVILEQVRGRPVYVRASADGPGERQLAPAARQGGDSAG